MDYLQLALEAKRNKDFSSAFEHYQQELDQKGLSVGLLDGIAEIYYLLHDNNAAVLFNLAARHLELYFNNEGFKQGDEGITAALEQIPEEVTNQFPHPIGATLYFSYENVKDLGHAILDHEGTYEQFPDFRTHAEIYYAYVLDDGSYEETLEKFNTTHDEQQLVNDQYYVDLGFQFLIDTIAWDEIENPDVFKLYLSEEPEE